MLNENIKAIRKSKGLSQQEFAVKLNVVRQTISKWEKGLSVPDSEMLVLIAEQLETSVSVLLGECIVESRENELKVISDKLEIINLQFSQTAARRRKIFHWLLITLCIVLIMIFLVLTMMQSPYLGWDYSDPETAVVGVIWHAFEWFFIRLAPIILVGAVVGIILTRNKF